MRVRTTSRLTTLPLLSLVPLVWQVKDNFEELLLAFQQLWRFEEQLAEARCTCQQLAMR